jgi:hypothetical protein
MKWWLIWSSVLIITLLFMYSGYRTFGTTGMISGAIVGLSITGGILVISNMFK